MENYYSSNALYKHLASHSKDNFRFAAGSMWQLVYGDKSCTPKALVLAVGTSGEEHENPPGKPEMEALGQLRHLSAKCGLPLLHVRFKADAGEIESVKTMDEEGKSKDVALTELTGIFKSFNLPTSHAATAKCLNDKSSSAYHNWQRSSLGRDLTVSDIDLWKLDKDGKPLCIYELKRSLISVDRWQPFPEDYRNFQLLSSLASQAEVGFRIAYNLRTKQPFHDDISRIKVFDVDFSKKPPVSPKGTFSLNEFFQQ